MGSSAGTLYAGDSQAYYLRPAIGEGNKAAFIAAPWLAGSFCTAVRADQKKQRVLFETLPVKVSDMQECIFQLAIKGV